MRTTRTKSNSTCARCSYAIGPRFNSCPRCGLNSSNVTDPPHNDAHRSASPKRTNEWKDNGPSSGESDSPAPKDDRNDIGVFLGVMLGLALIVAVGVELQQKKPTTRLESSQSSAKPLDSSAALTTEEYFVTAESLNIRREATTTSDVIGVLQHWNTVYVSSISDGWATVEIPGEGAAYISSKYLQRGDGLEAKTLFCQENRGRGPTSGEILGRTLPVGEHHLQITAGENDIAVRLKSESGTNLLSFFVAANHTETVDNIPDGRFLAFFALGNNWSRACDRFLLNMAVSKDPNPLDFSVDQLGRYSIMSYEFTERLHGNFRPASVDENAF